MNKFYTFMRGRYGADEMSAVAVIFALLLQIIISFFDIWWLCFLPLLPVAWAVFRIFSKNIAVREKENDIIKDIVAFFSLSKSKWRDRKTHVYFKCLRCKANLRLPKGKGELAVTCPRCKAKMRMKT